MIDILRFFRNTLKRGPIPFHEMAGTGVANAFAPPKNFRSNPSDKTSTPTGGGSVEAANTNMAPIYQQGDTGSQGHGDGGQGSSDQLVQFANNRIGNNTGIVRTQKALDSKRVFSDNNGVFAWNGGSSMERKSKSEIALTRGGVTPIPESLLSTQIGPQVRGMYGSTSRVPTASLRGGSLPGGGERFQFASPGFKLANAATPDEDLGDMNDQLEANLRSAHLQPRAAHWDHIKNQRYAIPIRA